MRNTFKSEKEMASSCKRMFHLENKRICNRFNRHQNHRKFKTTLITIISLTIFVLLCQSQVYVECTHINRNINSFGGDSEFLVTNVENVISLNETQRQVRDINQMQIESDTNEYIEETTITPENIESSNKDSLISENDTNLEQISSKLYEPEIKKDLTFDINDQSGITVNNYNFFGKENDTSNGIVEDEAVRLKMTEVVKPVINIMGDENISKNLDNTSSLYSIETGTEESPKKVLDEDQLITTSYDENEIKDQQNPESVNIKKTEYDNVSDDLNTHNVTEEYISSGIINEELSKINTTTEYFHSLSDDEDQSIIFTKNNQENEHKVQQNNDTINNNKNLYDNQPDNLNATKEYKDLIILENTNEEISEINTTPEYFNSVTDPSESSYEKEQSNAGIVKDGREYTNYTQIDEELDHEESEKVLDKTDESEPADQLEIIHSESFGNFDILKDSLESIIPKNSTEEISEIKANTENVLSLDQSENIYDLNNSLEIIEEETISDGKMVLIEENATEKQQEIESVKSMDITEYENINKESLNENVEENDLSSTNTQNDEILNSNAKEYTSEGDNIDSNEIRDMNESKRDKVEEEVTHFKQNPETNDNDLVRTTTTSIIEVDTPDLIFNLNNDLLNNSLEAQLTSSVDFEDKENKVENNDQESNQIVTVEESENILNLSESKTNEYTNNLHITEATLLISDDKLNNTEENNQNSFEYETSESSENTSNWITDINLHSETTEKTEQNTILYGNEEMPKLLDILKDIQTPNKQVTPLPIDDKAATSFESYQPPDVGRTFNDNLADESAGIGKALPVFVTDISRRSTIIIIFSCVTAFLFIVISLIIFLISFQRQHGTLDIEKQERNCGKDDLDEEDAQTFTKLLEVELPLSVVLALDESEECL